MTTELRWAKDTAVIELDDVVVAALLPDGPVWVLDGAGALLAGRMRGTFTGEELVDWATGAFDGDQDDIATGVAKFLATLRDAALVIDA